MWMQQERSALHAAKTEAKYNGLGNSWSRKMNSINTANRKRLGL